MDRVLLVGSINPVPGQATVWVAPGGTAERGESAREAAARELMEEVGVAVTPERLGPPIGVCEGPHRYIEYFVLPIGEFLPTVVNPDPVEREAWVGFRWFSAEDITETADIVWPLELAEVLRSGVLRQPPSRPLTFAWKEVVEPPRGQMIPQPSSTNAGR